MAKLVGEPIQSDETDPPLRVHDSRQRPLFLQPGSTFARCVRKTAKGVLIVIAPVAVLGAGIAGLATAAELKRRGVPAIVFEAAPKIAGLAQSFADEDGFTYDFGAHFVTNRLAEELDIADQCRDVPRYGESVWLKGRVYSYPFGLLRVPRFAMGGAVAQDRKSVV